MRRKRLPGIPERKGKKPRPRIRVDNSEDNVYVTPNADRVSIIDSNEYARRVVGGILIDKAGQYPIDGSLSNVNVDLVQALAWLGIQIASAAAFILDQAVEPSPDAFFHVYIDIDPLNQTHYTIRLQVPSVGSVDTSQFLRRVPTAANPNQVSPAAGEDGLAVDGNGGVLGGRALTVNDSTRTNTAVFNSSVTGNADDQAVVQLFRTGSGPGAPLLTATVLGTSAFYTRIVNGYGEVGTVQYESGLPTASDAHPNALAILRQSDTDGLMYLCHQTSAGDWRWDRIAFYAEIPELPDPLTFTAHTVIGSPGDIPALGLSTTGGVIDYTLNIPEIPVLPAPLTFQAHTVIGSPGDIPALGLSTTGGVIDYTLNIPEIPVLPAPLTFQAHTVIGSPGDIPALGLSTTGGVIDYTLNIPPIPTAGSGESSPVINDFTPPAFGASKTYKMFVDATGSLIPFKILTGWSITQFSCNGEWLLVSQATPEIAKPTNGHHDPAHASTFGDLVMQPSTGTPTVDGFFTFPVSGFLDPFVDRTFTEDEWIILKQNYGTDQTGAGYFGVGQLEVDFTVNSAEAYPWTISATFESAQPSWTGSVDHGYGGGSPDYTSLGWGGICDYLTRLTGNYHTESNCFVKHVEMVGSWYQPGNYNVRATYRGNGFPSHVINLGAMEAATLHTFTWDLDEGYDRNNYQQVFQLEGGGTDCNPGAPNDQWFRIHSVKIQGTGPEPTPY